MLFNKQITLLILAIIAFFSSFFASNESMSTRDSLTIEKVCVESVQKDASESPIPPVKPSRS